MRICSIVGRNIGDSNGEQLVLTVLVQLSRMGVVRCALCMVKILFPQTWALLGDRNFKTKGKMLLTELLVSMLHSAI